MIILFSDKTFEDGKNAGASLAGVFGWKATVEQVRSERAIRYGHFERTPYESILEARKKSVVKY